ncbi:hypothetical protein [Cognatishimia activa]|uniref:Uncharacterized protein n=1 Tax=Cognatishimia activa TaxID=1715691 RepID=A0A0P1IMN4_9RHOB|nr:hypothetical protein [Cognatishimia activa]CUI29775.1 hypothetical protein TA5113_00117 [Cognatishimia activa]CUK24887.1 hypothetical protein TA5114_00674 [Cognatishimia activa]
MIRLFMAAFSALAGKPAVGATVSVDAAADMKLTEALVGLKSDPYIKLADAELRIISVFDELRYDRADMDVLSGPMRDHAVEKLKPLGFKQVTGSSFLHAETGIRVLLPKSHALGGSPFDIARYTPRGEFDYYLLTPTQAACMMIDSYSKMKALERIKGLIKTQPINILRIADYLEKKPVHEDFEDTIGHLKFVQREAVESEPLRRRRALGSMRL